MGLIGSRRTTGRTWPTVAVLDIGSSKTVCFIARLENGNRPRIIGVGHTAGKGLKSGAIIDIEAASKSIGTAVHAAEQMADEQIDSVVVSVGGSSLISFIAPAQVAIDGRPVTNDDIRRTVSRMKPLPGDIARQMIHSIPVQFAVDGQRGINNPVGLSSNRLDIDVHFIATAQSSIRNIRACVAKAHLDVEAVIAAPIASGISCLVQDERYMGATVIDLGAGTTSVAVFNEGLPVFCDVIPVGGQSLTVDLAKGLTTPLAHAERLKTLFGTPTSTMSDAEDMIEIPQVGEDGPGKAAAKPRSLIAGIIRPRLEEIFDLVRSRLEMSGFDKLAGRRVVLTGGASQLDGIRDLAEQRLDKKVRLGRPIASRGLAESASGPGFSVVSGMLAYIAERPTDSFTDLNPTALGASDYGAFQPASLFGRMGEWVREHL
ncbi:MAG: cell division protein FtsA [Pseudomonadota bacterium]